MATTEPHATGVQEEDLQALLDGRYASLRRQIRDVLSRPEFAPPIAIPTAEYRGLVLEWMRAMAAEGLTAPGFPVEYGGHSDPGAKVRGDAGALVDAFGIPDEVLRAPIGLR